MPLNLLTTCNDFVVVNQGTIPRFVDGKATGEIDGIRLELFDASLLDRIVAKVPGNALPFEAEKVEGQQVHISLANPCFSFYVTNNSQLAISIKADGYKVIEKK